MLPIKQGQISIALVCVVLGVMLAVQFRTTQDIRSSIPFQRIEDLSQRLSQTEKERDVLVKQVEELKKSSGLQAVSREMETVKMGAGVVAVEGPGIIVTIDDSKRPSKPGENPNLYLIHDDDILKVINEMWAAGAEAISINEQRLIANSEIRCAGPTLSVNNTRYSPPYELRAIGDPQTLENALKMRGGVVETLQFWGIQVAIKKQEIVRVPAFKGAFRFEFAKPITESKEGGQ
ncbi:MAG TPA: DUF881 domain-containing protein [Methylomusa anaerophila]|uniref:Division initiation protein n=1 Tax=Methylomusa anaerophila TaxID=1930071 RepID=A0A348AQA9_9FIRM|nr:DUF881 domain-containing protein [Methylomusa anaerophila]BBB93257.1 hypothetical protein MAMMFC1_03969 [Methylomusa anaerophila]HML86911.1 DUF881 domain-containing protein [Methylomusa anaerophila]